MWEFTNLIPLEPRPFSRIDELSIAYEKRYPLGTGFVETVPLKPTTMTEKRNILLGRLIVLTLFNYLVFAIFFPSQAISTMILQFELNYIECPEGHVRVFVRDRLMCANPQTLTYGKFRSTPLLADPPRSYFQVFQVLSFTIYVALSFAFVVTMSWSAAPKPTHD